MSTEWPSRVRAQVEIPRSRGVEDMVAIQHETTDRIVRTVVFAGPPVALVVAGWLAWGGVLHWQDLLVLAITYTLTGLGVTVGYHRLFTHRSFKTTRSLRALLAVLGSMAVEGPVDEWVATHRRHHRFSDHADVFRPGSGDDWRPERTRRGLRGSRAMVGRCSGTAARAPRTSRERRTGPTAGTGRSTRTVGYRTRLPGIRRVPRHGRSVRPRRVRA